MHWAMAHQSRPTPVNRFSPLSAISKRGELPLPADTAEKLDVESTFRGDKFPDVFLSKYFALFLSSSVCHPPLSGGHFTVSCYRHQPFHHSPQILRSRCQQELVFSTGEPSQPQSIQLHDALEVRE